MFGAGGAAFALHAHGFKLCGGYAFILRLSRQCGGGGQQPTYNAPAGGASDDPWATGGATSFGDEPPF